MNMYFLAIVLPQHLNADILKYKEQMRDTYGCKVGLKSPAHITIIPPFWMEAALEEALLQDTDALCKNIPSFTIATHGFSAFKPRTIFVDVQPNEALATVKKEADAFFKQCTQYKAKIDTRPFHPHITIATRDLTKKAFAEAWPLFENKSFEATFSATACSVLKHNTRHWDVIHEAVFTAA